MCHRGREELPLSHDKPEHDGTGVPKLGDQAFVPGVRSPIGTVMALEAQRWGAHFRPAALCIRADVKLGNSGLTPVAGEVSQPIGFEASRRCVIPSLTTSTVAYGINLIPFRSAYEAEIAPRLMWVARTESVIFSTVKNVCYDANGIFVQLGGTVATGCFPRHDGSRTVR